MKEFNIRVFQDPESPTGKWYAQSVPIDIIQSGDTPEKALAHYLFALSLEISEHGSIENIPQWDGEE